MEDVTKEVYDASLQDFSLAILFDDQPFAKATIEKIRNKFPNICAIFAKEIQNGIMSIDNKTDLFNYIMSGFVFALHLLDIDSKQNNSEETSKKEYICEYAKNTQYSCDNKSVMTINCGNSQIHLCETHAKNILTTLIRSDGIDATIEMLNAEQKDFFLSNIIVNYTNDMQDDLAVEILNSRFGNF